MSINLFIESFYVLKFFSHFLAQYLKPVAIPNKKLRLPIYGCELMSLGLCNLMSLGLCKLISLTSGAQEAGGARRNQVLRNKFFQQKNDIKESHPHIIDWFDSNPGREIQTDIIHNCFSKNNRTWKIDMDKPFFKEVKKRCVLVRVHGSLSNFMSLELWKFGAFRIQKLNYNNI